MFVCSLTLDLFCCPKKLSLFLRIGFQIKVVYMVCAFFFLNVAFVFRRGFWQGDDLEHGASPQRGGREEREYSQNALPDGQSPR